MQSIYNSVNSLSQLQCQLDVTGHNIANVDTVGFKRQQGHFASLLSQAYDNQPRPEFEVGRDTPNGIRIGVGGHVADITQQFNIGQVRMTDRGLDVFLKASRQFFVVDTPNGVGVTRSGNMQLSVGDETTLVDVNGNPLLGDDGNAITMPNEATNHRIRQDGVVLASVNGVEQEFGRLDIVEVRNTSELRPLGENVFAADLETEVDRPLGNLLMEGTLESSNVDLTKEMTDMTITQRAYQMNSRALSMSDQMMGLVTALRP
ncbi:flagellar hook-basal body protein [Exiguobacterium sp. B2(2022)]|uniref:flagellar hook-basal body protein n=1 Tax=Exiguobacterium sp. B2(2022) TaxID=2992755 RepID=UPI00237AA860|nr:flagellar hook-basal body protein [Exiguobacterium sp. B2(2022)]MDE0564295.1 flagellar hook-basal body protein [Exiguobacterium sp. B2(2022)]